LPGSKHAIGRRGLRTKKNPWSSYRAEKEGQEPGGQKSRQGGGSIGRRLRNRKESKRAPKGGLEIYMGLKGKQSTIKRGLRWEGGRRTQEKWRGKVYKGRPVAVKVKLLYG